MKKNIGIVILATNAYFVLGIRLIKKFMYYYKGDNNITFYFFSDTNPKDYLPDSIDVVYTYTTNSNWVDGTNLKFSSILTINERLKSEYLYYFDADTNINREFTEDWFLGEMVGGQHYGDQDWMSLDRDGKAYDRNPASKAYIPIDTPLAQMYYYGAFFGGTSKRMIEFCETMLFWQKEDKQIPYEPCVNDESYINAYFHFNPPTKVVATQNFLFSVSDKGGIGETRNPDLNVNTIKEKLILYKDSYIEIYDGKCINF